MTTGAFLYPEIKRLPIKKEEYIELLEFTYNIRYHVVSIKQNIVANIEMEYCKRNLRYFYFSMTFQLINFHR